MNKLLSLDSPLMQKLTMLGELIVLSVLTILLSLPVITAGAAICALYNAVWHIHTREGRPIRDYWRSFCSNLPKATLIWLPVLITGLMLGYGAVLVLAIPESDLQAWKIPLLIGFFFWLMIFCWIFPLQSRFENSFKQTLINSILCAIRFFPRTLILSVVNLLPFALLWYNAQFFLVFGTLWFFVWPALAAYWNIWILSKPFEELISMIGTEDQSA